MQLLRHRVRGNPIPPSIPQLTGRASLTLTPPDPPQLSPTMPAPVSGPLPLLSSLQPRAVPYPGRSPPMLPGQTERGPCRWPGVQGATNWPQTSGTLLPSPCHGPPGPEPWGKEAQAIWPSGRGGNAIVERRNGHQHGVRRLYGHVYAADGLI